MNTTQTKKGFEGYQTTTGSKFVAGRDVTAIAKLIRADIKDAIMACTLVSCAKYSVKTDRYSMGQSITVTVSGLRRGDLANVTRAEVQAIVDAYNNTSTNWQSDYCNAEFSGSVSMSCMPEES